MSPISRVVRIGIACASAALVPSCAPKPIEAPRQPIPTFEQKPPSGPQSLSPLLPELNVNRTARDRVASGPTPTAGGPEATGLAAVSTPPIEGETEALGLEQVNLPVFVNEVFANALKLTVRIDQRVASRTDLVTLRTGAPLPATELYSMATKVLESYGVAASWDGHVLNIIPDDALMTQMPDVIRSRALPELPLPLRPIYQVVELREVSAGDMASWLGNVYGTKVKIFQSPKTNSVLLFGLPADVRAAVEAVQVLDKARLSGRRSLRINPTYWTAAKLAEQLVTVLKAEGYDASTSVSSQASAIMVIPIEASNSVILLAADPQLLAHARQWIDDFDQPANADPQSNIFVYSVRNTTADSLGSTVLGVLGGASGRAAVFGPEARLEGAGSTRVQMGTASPGIAAGGGPGAAGNQLQSATTGTAPGAAGQGGTGTGGPATGTTSTTLQSGTRLIVDRDRNALIIVGTAQEYERIRPLLTKLDVPPHEVLIEVTVAELSLTDSTNLGIEWSMLNHIGGGYTQSLGTTAGVVTAGGGGGGGLGIPAAGFNYTILNGIGQVRYALNALATNMRVNVLSTPRVLAKSGAQASIQVGTQVPIITSQGTTSQVQVGGNSGIIQSVEYQQTGVLLTVNPVVHSGDRVDLVVSQEVSSALPNTTSGISSPVIQNRDVKTELTLGDGQTVVIGGMISDTRNNTDEGIPYLKDIPLVGLMFKSESTTRDRTELLVFITPYVISADTDSAAITRQFRDQMQNWKIPTPGLQF